MPKDRMVHESLCCCEYDNMDGERSHILACCCDCQVVDHACDRCLTCQRVSEKTVDNLLATVEDRCRIPWCSGHGAQRVPLDLIPVVVIPLCTLVATSGPYISVLAALVGCVVILFSHATLSRRQRRAGVPLRSRIFYVCTLTSLLQLYYTFEFVLIGFREVLLWENLLLSTIFAATMYFLYRARASPGIVTSTSSEYSASQHKVGITDGNWAAPLQSQGDVRNASWCDVCKVEKPPRAGHCPVCNVCVKGRDHHCFWINNCVGSQNHQAFFFTLLLVIVCGCYGSHLTMTTICTPEMYLDWFLFPVNCHYVYADFPTALCFVSACYTIVGVTLLSFLLLQQLIYISQDVTAREFWRARHRRASISCGVCMRANAATPSRRGCYQNWCRFLTLGFQPGRRRQTMTDI